MKNILLFILLTGLFFKAGAQNTTLTNGIVYEIKSERRLANIRVLNKKTQALARTNDIGVFQIAASPGDTLEFSSSLYQTKDIAVNNTPTSIVYLTKLIMLDEVIVKENSLEQDLKETQRIYRSKGVFYNGQPHYYYLFLKPMTFIYENFKSEVIQARRFKKTARRELEGQEISKRFNEHIVQSVIPLDDEQAEDFVVKYWPKVEQMRKWNDYDIIQYIKQCYADSSAH